MVENVQVAEPTKTEAQKDKPESGRLKQSYERLVNRVSEELKDVSKLRRKQWEDALKSAREWMQRARPEVKREEVERLANTVTKDVRHALRSFTTRGDEWTRSEAFLTARDRGAQFLLKLATKVKDAAHAVESNLEETLTYHNDELVSSGRFLCAACQTELTVEQSGPLPACKCGKTDFRRKS
jgi:hypothetical protein